MKTFGLVVPKGGGRIFETDVATLLAGQEALASIISGFAELPVPGICTCERAGFKKVRAAGTGHHVVRRELA
ncbi:MAG: hypothetical protein WBW81_12945 [Methylocella sp.]